jgi:hypothetical protein
MPGNVNVIRSDGSVLSTDPETAAKLVAVGMRYESAGEQAERGRQEGEEAYYSQTGQRIGAGVEGVLSGVTLGISDHVIGDEESALRAQYNPGTRLGGEIVGAVGTALLTGGASLGAEGAAAGAGIGARIAARTPAGLVTRAANSAGLAAEARGVGAVGRGLVVGAVEGAGAGLQAEVANSALSGDPLTVETTLAGMGWGALFGGGIGGLAGGAASKLEAGVVARAEAKVAVSAEERLAGVANEAYGTLHGTFRDTGKTIGTAIDDATAQVGKLEVHAAKTADTLRSVPRHNLDEIGSAVTASREALNDVVGRGLLTQSETRAAHREAASALSALGKAVKSGTIEDIPVLIESFETRMSALMEAPGPTGQRMLKESMEGFERTPTPGLKSTDVSALEEVDAMAQLRLKTQGDSFKELASLGAASSVLKSAPLELAGFARMTEPKAEKVFGAVETVLKSGAPELEGTRVGLRYAIDGMAERMGLVTDATGAEKLRELWMASKKVASSSGETAATEAASGSPGWLRRQMGYAAGRGASQAAATEFGAGTMGRSLAYGLGIKMATGLLGLKGAILGKITEKAAALTPMAAKAARTAQRLGPRAEPLAVRLDGTPDDEKDRRKLLENRRREINEAAPTVRDTLFRGVQPLDVHHPEYAAALHAKAVEQFKTLYNELPRDPGKAFSKLKSLWKPDPVATEKFARVYEVFQNPVAVANRALDTLEISSEAAKALRTMDPELFTHLRVNVLERLAHPDVMDSLDYGDQCRLGTLLDLPLHSTLTPRFIAPQQQMFTIRNEPLTLPPQPGMSNGGGSGGGTQAQKLTER